MSQHDELGDVLSLDEKNGKYEILLKIAANTKNCQMLKCSDDLSKTDSSVEMSNMTVVELKSDDEHDDNMINSDDFDGNMAYND